MALLFDLCIRPDAKPVDLIAAIARSGRCPPPQATCAAGQDGS